MATSAVPTQQQLSSSDVEAIDELRKIHNGLREELARVIVGQTETIDQLAICFFARGHALLMGVPGLAKTLLVSKLAETLTLDFNRIQFTPDLMPMDITGTDILQDMGDGRREFQFVHGPVFANIVLADEINRAPPKTQAALLEAMQERRVTVLAKPTNCRPLSSSLQRRIRSSKKERIRYRRRNSTDLCSSLSWTIRRRKRRFASLKRRRAKSFLSWITC